MTDFVLGHWEPSGEIAYAFSERDHLWFRVHLYDEVLELRPRALLNCERELRGLMQHLGHLLKVVDAEPTRAHRRRAEPHATRRGGGLVAVHRILIQRDSHRLAKPLHF